MNILFIRFRNRKFIRFTNRKFIRFTNRKFIRFQIRKFDIFVKTNVYMILNVLDMLYVNEGSWCR